MFSLLGCTAEPSCVLKAARGHEAVTHSRMGVRPPPPPNRGCKFSLKRWKKGLKTYIFWYCVEKGGI